MSKIIMIYIVLHCRQNLIEGIKGNPYYSPERTTKTNSFSQERNFCFTDFHILRGNSDKLGVTFKFSEAGTRCEQ